MPTNSLCVVIVAVACAAPMFANVASAAERITGRPEDGLCDVEVMADLVYAKSVVRDGAGVARLADMKLDAYLPRGCASIPKPALLMIHGGGFRGGDKGSGEFQRMGQFLAERGYVALSMNYRLLGDNPPVPAAFEQMGEHRSAHAAFVDAKRALRWLRANRDLLGIDPARIAVLGGSAGAVTALHVGFAAQEAYVADGPDDPAVALDHPEQSSGVRGVIACWGTADLVLDQIERGDPPVMVVHGTADANPNTPFAAAERLRDRCDAVGVPCAFYALEGWGHGAWAARYDGFDLNEIVFAFLKRHVGAPASPPR